MVVAAPVLSSSLTLGDATAAAGFYTGGAVNVGVSTAPKLMIGRTAEVSQTLSKRDRALQCFHPYGTSDVLPNAVARSRQLRIMRVA